MNGSERFTGSSEFPFEHVHKDPHDITSPKKKLYQEKACLHCILQNTEDLIFATDPEGRIILFSAGGEKILGYTWQQVEGHFIKEFACAPSAFERAINTAEKTGSVKGEVHTFRHRDGHTVECRVSLVGQKDSRGGFTGIIGICREISNWKEFQGDLIRIDRLAEVGRMASAIAHEINNPLAVINEISGWAGDVISATEDLSQEDRADFKTATERIMEQTERCRILTYQLLDFVREGGIAKEGFFINDLLSKTVAFLNPELKYYDIDIAFCHDEGIPQIRSDDKMLEQVIVNLLSNAIYAIKEKGQEQGRIEMKTSMIGTDLVITISDNGTGIAPEAQEKVFELFYTTKPSGKGTGLGMPICRKIIQKLGGEITLESELNKGTTFTVRIPVS